MASINTEKFLLSPEMAGNIKKAELCLFNNKLWYETCADLVFVSICTYQTLAGFWDSTDIHRLPVDSVDKASLWHTDGTDDVGPSEDQIRQERKF